MSLLYRVQFTACDVDDDAGKPSIADQQIAAAAEDEKTDSLLAGETVGIQNLAVGLRLDEETRRSTDSERRIRRKYYVFLNLHEF